LSGDQRHKRSIEGDVDETIGGGGLLDTLDKAVLPKEFPRVSPSEPRERGSLFWDLGEEQKGVLTLSDR
jgi:hypothetical protein